MCCMFTSDRLDTLGGATLLRIVLIVKLQKVSPRPFQEVVVNDTERVHL